MENGFARVRCPEQEKETGIGSPGASHFLFRLIRPVIPVNSTTHCNMKGKEKKTRPEVDELNFS